MPVWRVAPAVGQRARDAPCRGGRAAAAVPLPHARQLTLPTRARAAGSSVLLYPQLSQPLVPLVDEFAARLFGELDYVAEGKNCEKFGRLYRCGGPGSGQGV